MKERSKKSHDATRNLPRDVSCNFVDRFFVIALSIVSLAIFAEAQTRPTRIVERNRYEINLKLDFDARSYTGQERVRWVNRSDQSISLLYFHLYSNLRVDAPGVAPNAKGDSPDTEEPNLQITEVRSATSNTPLPFLIDDQGTTLRVSLREPVPAGQSTEVMVVFKGTVPEVDPDESSLTAHVVKQISAALRDEREMRRARDINFRCRGVMLLGTSYPILAVHDGNDWMRKVEPGVGDLVFSEVADYDVNITVDEGVVLFTSAAETDSVQQPGVGESRRTSVNFSAGNLRDFAIVAGRNLRAEQIQVGDTTLRSIFVPEHERMGKRVLTMAGDALRTFNARFGALPLKTISIAAAPLTAGLGSTEFSGLDVIASAFYVDFDSPSMRNLPGLIREQRPSVEESLEWSVAHLIAHQWWGGAVGNDPARDAVLDESMASWSALQYFNEIHGEKKAAAVLEDQLRGVYRVYRTLGGVDMDANRPSREYKNSFQYTAIVTTKGALMFVQLQQLLGREKLQAALRNYYQANLFEIASVDDLRGALIAESPIEQRRLVARTFDRWLASKKGDEDIATPDQELAVTLGLPTKPPQKSGERNALNAFARLGKFFWQQMTRIR
ncbi:MAG TPA: M1 family metallopeptidase [Pyrinomonadaceae bacterium]|nr:M1 family metallopeptidase [Pyrinomonadaceae bacterium]